MTSREVAHSQRLGSDKLVKDHGRDEKQKVITTYSIVFLLSYDKNNSPVRIKQLLRILFFSPLILRELTNYNSISYTYISSCCSMRLTCYLCQPGPSQRNNAYLCAQRVPCTRFITILLHSYRTMVVLEYNLLFDVIYL